MVNLNEDFHNPSRKKKKLISIRLFFKLPDHFNFQQTIRAGIQDLLGNEFSIKKTWSLPTDPLEKFAKLEVFVRKSDTAEIKANADQEYRVRQFLSLIRFRYIPNHIHPSEILKQEQVSIQNELLSKLRRSKKVTQEQQGEIFEELSTLSKDFVKPIISELQKGSNDIKTLDLSTPHDLGELLFSFAPRLQVEGGENFSALQHGSGVQSYLTMLVLRYLDSRFSSRFGWHQSSIWAIEEPESFLHKDLEHRIATLLSETAKEDKSRFQIFCTTHSDVFVRYSDKPIFCTMSAGKTHPEVKDVQFVTSESSRQGIASYVPPILFGAARPLLIVEGPSDKILIEYAYAAKRVACPWEVQDVKSVTSTQEGIDGLKSYLKINIELVRSRSIRSPICVLVDWNESATKVAELQRIVESHPTSFISQWERNRANTDLDETFSGIERYLSSDVILDANQQSILKAKRPAAGDFPLSVERHSIKKVQLAKFIVDRGNPADVELFESQLNHLEATLADKQLYVVRSETGNLF
jgi:AAA ATPase domain